MMGRSLADIEARYPHLPYQLQASENGLPMIQTTGGLQQSATINQAWQTLRHPLTRAEYLLSLHGFDLASEQHTVRDTA
ncbi:Fe-S protein assembly co-chaperone HscB, partial [Klebsiella michiganensis]|uniref:Fe-S protein assembly co-chaperone HscB n=1 Tax=Klebsiella michiganensis TaxID=1134687 RepID=UPI00396A954C